MFGPSMSTISPEPGGAIAKHQSQLSTTHPRSPPLVVRPHYSTTCKPQQANRPARLLPWSLSLNPRAVVCDIARHHLRSGRDSILIERADVAFASVARASVAWLEGSAHGLRLEHASRVGPASLLRCLDASHKHRGCDPSVRYRDVDGAQSQSRAGVAAVRRDGQSCAPRCSRAGRQQRRCPRGRRY